MRILLDEQLPRRFARHIGGHLVRTAQQQGWAGLKNGELLRRAVAGGFDVFVTADQNLRFQQNLAGLPVTVMVLVAPSNALEDLLPLVPSLLEAIRDASPGDVRVVGTRNVTISPYRTHLSRPAPRSSRPASRRRRRGG